MPTSSRSVTLTNSITGPIAVITAANNRARRNMFLTMLSATTIWTTTATGAMIPTTDMYGTRMLRRDGRLTTMVIGTGSTPGDTPGSMIRPGATLHSITGAGLVSADAGVG